jgi:hypothetical protein
MSRISILGFLTLVVAGCDGHTGVNGRVLDSDGKPIPRAKVDFKQDGPDDALHASRQTTTDEQGHFSIGRTHAPSKKITFTLTVPREGFKTYRETVTYENKHSFREITLSRTRQSDRGDD